MGRCAYLYSVKVNAALADRQASGTNDHDGNEHNSVSAGGAGTAGASKDGSKRDADCASLGLVWLNLFNAELSAKSHRRGRRSIPKSGGRGRL